MNKRNIFMRVSLDLLCPTVEDLTHLEKFFQASSSLVRHDIIIHSVKYPVIVTYSKTDSLELLGKMKEFDWEEVKKKPELI
jgi:hypothetical protein